MEIAPSEPLCLTPLPSRQRNVLLACCVVLSALFALLCATAVVGKSVTYDEPSHFIGGYFHRYAADYRMNPADPALLGWYASLLTPEDAVNSRPITSSAAWNDVVNDASIEWPLLRAIFRGDKPKLLRAMTVSRMQFVLIGFLLAALVARVSWQIGGATAAVAAVTCFAFDPTLLAHAGLIKNDVAISLTFLLTAYAAWLVGIRATPWRLSLLAAGCAIGVCVKFSGVLLGPCVVILLVTRTLLHEPWQFLRWVARTRLQRVALATGICVLCAIVSFAAIWTSYGFRFAATRDGKLLDTASLEARSLKNQKVLDQLSGRSPDSESSEEPAVPALIRTLRWMESKRVLPQPWIMGMMYTYANGQVRSAYLMGEISPTGFHRYFPLAVLFKTPLATLLAATLGILVWAVSLRGKVLAGDAAARRWATFCLTVPPLLYALFALTTNLNIGIRHVLPLYPFLFIAIGLVTAAAVRARPRVALPIALLLAASLAIESLASYPNYIPFFNVAAGGSRGGLKLLSDSNLDWGQDMLLLKAWQEKHPDTRLYFSNFGIATPATYAIQCVPVVDNTTSHTPDGLPPREPGVFAVQASVLSGVYLPPELRKTYTSLQEFMEPDEILGGSIYLYRWPPNTSTAKRSSP